MTFIYVFVVSFSITLAVFLALDMVLKPERPRAGGEILAYAAVAVFVYAGVKCLSEDFTFISTFAFALGYITAMCAANAMMRTRSSKSS